MNDLSTRSAKTIKGQFFPAFSELQRTYTVSIAYSGGNTAEATHIRYSVDLRCARLLDNGDCILELSRSEERINDADASDNIATALAQSSGRILYPLQLHVSGQGRLLAITNHAEILNRWEGLIPQLRQYYSGELAEDYIAQTGRALSDANTFRQAMANDLLSSVYFGLVYTSNVDGAHPIVHDYSLVPGMEPLKFDIIQTAEIDALEDFIMICQKGQLAVGLTDSPVKSGTMQTTYTLNADNAQIEHLHADWQLDVDGLCQHISISATSMVS